MRSHRPTTGTDSRGALRGREALVVMAKAPIPGLVKTRLAAAVGDEPAAALYAAMLGDTLDCAAEVAASRSRLEIVVAFTPADARSSFERLVGSHNGFTLVAQCDGNLGARLAHVFERCFDEGADRIAAIGADAPAVAASVIAGAFSALESGADVALGPALDGGYYLVATSGFAPAIFERISWSGPEVLAETVARARDAALAVALLPPSYDVDEAAGLSRLAREIRDGSVVAPRTATWLDTHARLVARLI